MSNGPSVPVRAFNGLNGAEVRTRIVQEIERELGGDSRLGVHLTFPVVTWKWTLELSCEPMPGEVSAGKDGAIRSEVRGRVVAEGSAGAPALRESALADPRGRPVQVSGGPGEVSRFSERPVSAAGVSGPAPAPVASAMEERFARLEALVMRVVGEQRTSGAQTTGASGVLGSVPSTTSEGFQARGHHPDIDMTTATGLPIVGGAMPSPGAALAASFGGGSSVGVVAPVEPAAAAENWAVGVQHLPLDEGGVGPPDAVRREAGLPVPQMQVTPGGGIVDLPAGTF